MNLIIGTILKEKNRIEYQLEEYRKNIKDLPKGTLLGRKGRNGQLYYYLKYRDAGKVVSKYIGKDVEDLSDKISKRKHIDAMIKLLEEELKIANKALEGNIWYYTTEAT